MTGDQPQGADDGRNRDRPALSGAPQAHAGGKFLKVLLLLLVGVDFTLAFILYKQVSVAEKAYDISQLSVIGGLILAIVTTFLLVIKTYSTQYTSASGAIPHEDRKLLESLISDQNSKGIELYIQIASLRGPTKAATTLGLTGLPLATIGLTIFFSFIALFKTDPNFFDLAKLTLGAFIGSFVQRSNEVIERAVRRASASSEPAAGAAAATLAAQTAAIGPVSQPALAAVASPAVPPQPPQ